MGDRHRCIRRYPAGDQNNSLPDGRSLLPGPAHLYVARVGNIDRLDLLAGFSSHFRIDRHGNGDRVQFADYLARKPVEFIDRIP